MKDFPWPTPVEWAQIFLWKLIFDSASWFFVPGDVFGWAAIVDFGVLVIFALFAPVIWPIDGR